MRVSMIAAAVCCAIALAGVGVGLPAAAQEQPGACTTTATDHIASAKQVIDAAFARKRWRKAKPLTRKGRRKIAGFAECAGEGAAEIRRYRAERKRALLRYARERFARCAPRDCKLFARRLVGRGQFGCLDSLWGRESGWRRWANNPSSSAHGIPQALPGSKMGAGWEWNGIVQIKWGLSYIRDRYGSPCAANSAQAGQGWY